MDKGRVGKISPSLPGNLLLLLPALPLTRSGWQGPHRKRGMSAMRSREKGEMEVNPCIRPLLNRGGRHGKGSFGELWYPGPTSVAARGLGFGRWPPPRVHHCPPTPGRLQPPSHGTDRALLRLLGRRTQVLTAEPGFMGVAAGRGVSMWPPCKERQNPVSLGRASPSHSCAISSGNSTSQSGLLRAGVEMGRIWQWMGNLGTKLWSWGREREAAEQCPEQSLEETLWRGKVSPFGACLSSRIGREGAHQSFLGRPNK